MTRLFFLALAVVSSRITRLSLFSLMAAIPLPVAQVGVIPAGEVQIPVSVTNKDGKFISGLAANSFHLLEGGVEQKITYFAETQNAPVTLGIILDVSGSMNPVPRGDVAAFKNLTRLDNEYFLIGFAATTQMNTDFSPDLSKLLDNVGLQTPGAAAKPKGKTALYDAMYTGFAKLEKASHRPRALVVISDAEDNQSRYSLREIQYAFRSSNVQLFYAGTHDYLRKLAEETGGRAFDFSGRFDFSPGRRFNLAAIVNEVVSNLNYQYVLGYRPSAAATKGNGHTIRVNLAAPDNADPKFTKNVKTLTARSRTRYDAPSRK